MKAFELLKDTDQEAEIVLMQTAHIVKIFERLAKYVKEKENRVLIGVLLKTGRLYIEQFTKHTIPFFTSTFKDQTHSILTIFKDFQASTRLLQVIILDISIRIHAKYRTTHTDHMFACQSTQGCVTQCVCATIEEGIGNCHLSSQNVAD